MAGPSNPLSFGDRAANPFADRQLGFGPTEINKLLDATQALRNYDTATQSVGVTSNGTTTFAPTYNHASPSGAFLVGKDATASGMLCASQAVTVCTATGITVTHDTAAAAGSAFAVLVYS